MAVGVGEAFGFGFLLNKGLDHPDAADVFLDDAVQPVQALLQDGKERVRPPDDKNDVDENQGESAGHDYPEAQVQTQQGPGAAEEEHQAADKSPDELHDQLLHLGDIVGNAGDKRAGGKVIGLLKRKVHDARKTGLAEKVSAALTGDIGADC